MKIVSSLVVALLLANSQEINALRLHAAPAGDAVTATKENQPIVITPSAYAPAPAPAAPTCGCSNCGASQPTVIQSKSSNKGAAAARKAEKSTKHAIEKLEKKMDDKQAAKDTVNAIEKVKDEQKKADDKKT